MKTISLFGKGAVSGYILFVLMTLCSMASAQQPPNSNQSLITGYVSDYSGTLMDASVHVKEKNTIVYTDENGFYSISASDSDVLVFTYPGYTAVEVVVGNQLSIDVELSGSIALEEAVINAGYYTVKDKERTGSIFRVDSEVMEKQPVNNVLEALQGRVPGLDIVSTSGVAGSGYTVRIRGQNSIAAGKDPLYVIDGVPFDMGSLSNTGTSLSILPGGNVNPLNSLDPSSIESIEILKDADATAIYGSRGANGVILINTKKGKYGKTTFSVEASTSVISATRMMDLLNTSQYLEMRRLAFENDGVVSYPDTAYDINGTWDSQRYTDWQKELIGNTAYNQNFRTSVSAGSEQTRFTVGASFMRETTVFPMDFAYKKYAAFANLSHQSRDEKFNFQFSANYGQDSNNLPTTDLTRKAISLSPNAPALYDESGGLNWENSTWENPLAALQSTYSNSTNNVISNAMVSYRIGGGITLKTNFGYSRSELSELQLNPHTIYNPALGLTSASSKTFKSDGSKDSWIIEPQLDAFYNIGKGKLNVTVGGTIQQQNSDQMAILAEGFANNELMDNLAAAQFLTVSDEFNRQYKYLAAYARLNYVWDGRYILNLTGRRDGSSRFGPGNRFANFGAIGAAWVFSKENFLSDLEWLSFGKLRASLGTTGNDQIGDYQYMNTYSVSNLGYDGNIGLTPTRLYNPYFAWEKNRKAEAALELGFFNDRLRMEVAYYDNRSDNQLVGIPLPGTTGFGSINSNLEATVSNSGWELNVESVNIRKKHFKWESSFALSVPRNELISFPDLENSTYANSLAIGYPLSIYKFYHLTGVNPETGIFEFEDYDGDGIISAPNDRQFVADLTPKILGSISNSFGYKNWNLDFMFQFVKKKALNEYYGFLAAGTMSNQPIGVLNSWQAAGDASSYQQYTSGSNSAAMIAYSRFGSSSGVVSDASFLRLKTASLSYKLPLEDVADCTIFFQGQNLFTITGFKGGDPEQLRGYLPPMRRFLMGVRIDF